MKEKKLLDTKISEYSDIIEQNLEEILNELISNNYKLRNLGFGAGFDNEANEIYGEINKLAISILTLTLSKNKNGLHKIWLFHGNGKNNPENLVREIARLIRFADNLKCINNSISLIKYNINELYEYPTFKKQAYIPDFALMISSFFKENIDIFFQNNKNDINKENRMSAELKKITSLSHKVLNEFSRDISDGNIDIISNENQVIYYSNIISCLELIAITIFDLIFI